jgi:hypothetical protein
MTTILTRDVLARERAYHADPRELILMAAERSGLLREIGELLFFLSKQPSEHSWCAEAVLLGELSDNLDGVCPDISDMLGPGYEGFNPPYFLDGSEAEAAEFETFLRKQDAATPA